MTRQRLDEALVARGLYASRSRARDAILRGSITVNQQVISKPAFATAESDEIRSGDEGVNYVSRAALKLKFALAHFGVGPKGWHCLDIGASTGGFTQVLLEAGAAQVTALDVGHGQMHERIAKDPRVKNIEGFNIRAMGKDDYPAACQLIVCDVSFISLKTALPATLELAAPGTFIIVLIKPQFEAGRDHIGKGGLVTDLGLHEAIIRDIAEFFESSGWQVSGHAPSPLTGGDGNQEYVMAAVKKSA